MVERDSSAYVERDGSAYVERDGSAYVERDVTDSELPHIFDIERPRHRAFEVWLATQVVWYGIRYGMEPVE